MFERTSGQTEAVAHSRAIAAVENIEGDDHEENKTDSDEVFARAEASAIAASRLFDSDAFAMSHSEAIGLSVIPIGATTFVPTVSASSAFVDTASANGASVVTGDARHDRNFNQADSTSSFLLELSGANRADFHGTLYIAEYGGGVASGEIAGSTVDESISSSITVGADTYSASAQYRQASHDWFLTADLPGGVMINQPVGSVNQAFYFVLPVADGSVITFSSNVDADAETFAILDNPPVPDHAIAQLQLTSSASAWGYATPIGTDLPPGDFDGDGDVDNNDFEIWQHNIGAGPGATLTQGDADHDGNVDQADFNVWRANASTPGVPGDYNHNGKVDAADYTVWRDKLGSTESLAADGNFDGTVNLQDYDVWRTHFGDPMFGDGAGVGSTSAVPEPPTIALMVLGYLLAFCFIRPTTFLGRRRTCK